MVNSLAFAAVAPFVGHLSDIVGRRYLGLFGATLVVIGMIAVGTCHEIVVAIGGMAISGAGAGICQVIGLSGLMEMVPVSSRGKYVGTVFILFSPFGASTAYGLSLL